jgi:hypothetical protein
VGAIVTLLASLLAKVTVVSAAAAVGKVTGNGADCPGARVTPLGSPMAPALWTVTVAVPLATSVALAVIVAVPPLTPCTLTWA